MRGRSAVESLAPIETAISTPENPAHQQCQNDQDNHEDSYRAEAPFFLFSTHVPTMPHLQPVASPRGLAGD